MTSFIIHASALVVVDDLDHDAMVRSVQRYRLNGYRFVSTVRNMVTGRYRVEARRAGGR